MAGQKKQAKTQQPATPVAQTKPVQNTVEEDTEMTPFQMVSKQFETFSTELSTALATIASLRTRYRTLEKDTLRLLKTSQKRGNKHRAKPNGERKPSGFTKPAPISDELASFLNKPSGTLMARTDVTKEMTAYVKQHKLQGKENGRIINPDKKLSTLLKINKGEQLTYFNLQKYMSPHFPKATA